MRSMCGLILVFGLAMVNCQLLFPSGVSTIISSLKLAAADVKNFLLDNLNVDSDLIDSQFLALEDLIEEMPSSIDKITAELTDLPKNVNAESVARVSSHIIVLSTDLLQRTRSVGSNLTNTLTITLDTGIKRIIDEADERLVKTVTRLVTPIMDGALESCVPPLTNTVKGFALEINAGLQGCIQEQMDKAEDILDKIEMILETTNTIIRTAGIKLNACEPNDAACVTPIATTIKDDGLSLVSTLAGFASVATQFFGQIEGKIAICMSSKSGLALYHAALAMGDLFNCASY